MIVLENSFHQCIFCQHLSVLIAEQITPATAEARLTEIRIRQYDLDVQINSYAFSCFITAFSDIEGFVSMP